MSPNVINMMTFNVTDIMTTIMTSSVTSMMTSKVSGMITSTETTMVTSGVTNMMTFNETSTNGSHSNITRFGPPRIRQDLIGVVQTFALVIIIVIMLGVGCSIDVKMIIKYFKQPKEFLTGLCLQLFGMPLAGLAVTQMLRMSTVEALGVIIQSIAPGGVYSNLVTYWLDGDLNLSTVMTTISTILAFGSMSLWLFIISKILNLEQSFSMPYDSIGIAAGSTVASLIVGGIFGYFFPKIASKITKIFSIIGSICIIITIILNGVAGTYNYPFSYKIFLAAIILITIAVFFGYAATRVPWLNLEPSCRRTIAIETVYQNTSVSFSIIVLSFSSAGPAVFAPMSFFPICYSLLLLGLSAVVIIVYKILKAKGVKFALADTQHDVV